MTGKERTSCRATPPFVDQVAVILRGPGEVKQRVERRDDGVAVHAGHALRRPGQVEQGNQRRRMPPAAIPTDGSLFARFGLFTTSRPNQPRLRVRAERVATFRARCLRAVVVKP